MQTVIVLIHLMVVLAMIGVVLLQRSEGGGLGIGSTGGFMSSRGTANVLTRATAVLAATFFVTSLALSILAGLSQRPISIIRTETPGGAPSAPGAPAPLGSGGGVLDALRSGGGGAQPQAPSAPAAPSGPEVPRSQ
ncbi:MAG: preprotein translocase subunit SecG [Rhodoplanes sp.]